MTKRFFFILVYLVFDLNGKQQEKSLNGNLYSDKGVLVMLVVLS